MKKQHGIAVFAALFCLLHNARSQNNIEQYVHEHAFPIASINHDSTNYADLEVIGRAIGNARVVMLGEQDHGNAATFQAKTRIIKYLHEQKGFDVLAFEGDFFGMNYGWEQVKNTEIWTHFSKKRYSPYGQTATPAATCSTSIFRLP